MTALLWGISEEEPLAAVRWELERLGFSYLLIDQRTQCSWKPENGPAQIIVDGVALDLKNLSSYYVRPHDCSRLSPENRGIRERANEVQFEQTFLSWLDRTDATVINRPSAMLANSSKPFQLQWIHKLGFATPRTLVTTCRAEAMSFWNRHGSVIYKSVSGIRSRVSRLRQEDMDRLADVVHCPTQFQEYIPGEDYRVHVVENRVFASRIRCEADDYRYANRFNTPPTIFATTLPAEIRKRCVEMVSSMGLKLAGVDLRLSSSGVWYCFEVNPSPAFSYYESLTGQPIAQAIAELLGRGDCFAAKTQVSRVYPNNVSM